MGLWTWQGWTSPTDQDPPAGAGWMDLSHPIHPEVPRIALFPPPRVQRVRSIPADPMNVTELQVVCHVGTHVDAPCHFIPGGPSIDQVPLERLCGPAVVWRVAAEPLQVIDVPMLEAMSPHVRPGDILLLNAGWSQLTATELYHRHPYLSPQAAAWIVERGVKLLGIDFPTPDAPVEVRPADFDWPVHHILLSRGVLVAENLANLHPFDGCRIEVMFVPLRIQGADGAPARVLARPVGQ